MPFLRRTTPGSATASGGFDLATACRPMAKARVGRLGALATACASNHTGDHMERTASLLSIVPYAVTMSVQDIDASARWYVEKLGFREVQRENYPEFKTSLVFLELNGYRVELIQDGNATSGATRPDPPVHTAIYGISQFAFRTTDL